MTRCVLIVSLFVLAAFGRFLALCSVCLVLKVLVSFHVVQACPYPAITPRVALLCVPLSVVLCLCSPNAASMLAVAFVFHLDGMRFASVPDEQGTGRLRMMITPPNQLRAFRFSFSVSAAYASCLQRAASMRFASCCLLWFLLLDRPRDLRTFSLCAATSHLPLRLLRTRCFVLFIVCHVLVCSMQANPLCFAVIVPTRSVRVAAAAGVGRVEASRRGHAARLRSQGAFAFSTFPVTGAVFVV